MRLFRLARGVVALSLAGLLAGTLSPAVSSAETTLPRPDITPGRVVTWGGPPDLRQLLQPPAGLDDVVAVAASDTRGSYSNLALRADGTVVGWGLNAYGEATPPADLTDVVAVDTGAGFSLALRGNGSVVTWGTNSSGQLDVPADLGPVTAVSAGGYPAYRGLDVPELMCGYALALRPDGTVVRWGQDQPERGCELIDARMDPPAGLADVVAISAGPTQALALRADGTVVAWGQGVRPGLDGTPPADWSDVVAVSAGSGNSLGLRADGTVLAYGIWGESGPPPALTDVAAISASNVDVFLHRDSTISTYRDTPPPGPPAGRGFVAVSAGYDYGLAIKAPPAKPTEPPPLLGSAEIQPAADTIPAGTAVAFRYVATASDVVRNLNVYLDQDNAAEYVVVGVYRDVDGEPGRLVARGYLHDGVAGDWNTVTVSPVRIRAERAYWIALVSPVGAGDLVLRDRADGDGGPSRLSARHNLTAWRGLPTRWRNGEDLDRSPASLYLSRIAPALSAPGAR